MNSKLTTFLASWVRHAFTAAAGWIASVGVTVPQETTDAAADGTANFIVAVVLGLIAMLWSYFEKKLTLPS